MEEFLKIDWSLKDVSQLEQTNFISEECIAKSYVFTGLQKPAERNDIDNNSEHEIADEKKFIPGKAFFVQGKKPSKLNKLQQYQCLRALQILQEGTDLKSLSLFDQKCIPIYNSLKNVIQEENVEFLEHVRKQWKFKKLPNATSYFFITKVWEKQLSRGLAYKSLYRRHTVIPLSGSEDEGSVEVTHQSNILEIGSVAKFSRPTLKSRCLLKLSFSKDDLAMTVNSKLSVSQDKNVPNLLEFNQFDLAISSSALKKIMDSDNSQSLWDIPVVVRIEKGKKIVYIDKVLARTKPTTRELNEKLHKILVRANLCQFEALSFPIKEDLIPSPDIIPDLSAFTMKKTEKRAKKSPSKSNDNDNNENADEECDNTNLKINLSRHNVSYRIWSMKQIQKDSPTKRNAKELKILVRCKLDACEVLENGSLQPLVITPKLEYQLGYGGEVPTKTELCNLWTSLFFRPYSNSYRIRLNSTTSEVAVIEPCSLQKINNEAMHFYKMKPCLGLSILYRVFQELVKLDVGDYLLHHTPKEGSFVTLLTADEERLQISTRGIYDLHEEYKLTNCTPTPRNRWRPIDLNFILPMHIAYRRMPGMFVPTIEASKNKKKKKKNKARKRKLAEQS